MNHLNFVKFQVQIERGKQSKTKSRNEEIHEPNVNIESIILVIPFKGARLACAPHPSPYESDSSK